MNVLVCPLLDLGFGVSQDLGWGFPPSACAPGPPHDPSSPSWISVRCQSWISHEGGQGTPEKTPRGQYSSQSIEGGHASQCWRHEVPLPVIR